MVGYRNKKKSTAKIKALFTVDKHAQTLDCDNHYP